MEMDERFPKRKNPRAKSFDYTTPGFYFITICAAVRNKDLFSRLTYDPAVGAVSLGGPPAGTRDFAATEPPAVILTPLGEMVKQHIGKYQYALSQYESGHIYDHAGSCAYDHTIA